MLLRDIISQITGNIFTLCLVELAFLILFFTLMSIISPKRVKVRKRIIQQDSKFALFTEKVIGKSIILTKMKETIRIQVGLVSSKSDHKNHYYASVTVFVILGLALVEAVAIMIAPIPIVFKPLSIIVGFVFPYMFVTAYITGRRKRIYNDFPELVSIFIAKYAGNKNIKEGLKKSIPDLPNSLRHEIKRLINSMNTAEDYTKTLDEFEIRVNYVMCTAFVAILKTAYKTNTDIISSLLELETYISQERLENQRKVEQLKDKKGNIYMLIGAIVVTYFGVVSRLQEKAINFYWHTLTGQALMGAAFICCIAAIGGILLEDYL